MSSSGIPGVPDQRLSLWVLLAVLRTPLPASSAGFCSSITPNAMCSSDFDASRAYGLILNAMQQALSFLDMTLPSLAPPVQRQTSAGSPPVLMRTTRTTDAIAVCSTCCVHSTSHTLLSSLSAAAPTTICTYLDTVPSTTCVSNVRRGHSLPSALRPSHLSTSPTLSAVAPPDTRASGALALRRAREQCTGERRCPPLKRRLRSAQESSSPL
ncbi:hypothetical protein B0H17DRAFT_1342487 [Mycena rosella]|uniref:Secreted protein n=1 Tax=Mycena rosella TaxID=1033263 RepID=A0AAD7F7J5_MYCRO|nr:hypothetical protein B0H17DRAFT_1342487 [Mycena rosella]